VLRAGRLRQAHIAGQITDCQFAMLDQLAQQHQPARIADRLERVGNLSGLHFECRQVHRRFEHHRRSIRYCLCSIL